MLVNICLILALVIYIFMLYHSYKCQNEINCLSDIAYDGHKNLFPMCMISMSILIFIGLLETTLEIYQPICFLILVFMSIMATVPYLDGKKQYWIHFCSAALSMILICILWALKGFWFIPFVMILTGLRKKFLLGLEMSLITSAFLYLLI